MKEFDIRNVVKGYAAIAELKEEVYPCGRQVVATQVFGAQQLAVLYWAATGIEIDIQKVISMLAFHQNHRVYVPMGMRFIIWDFDENTTPEARFAHFCLAMEEGLQAIGIQEYSSYIKLIKKKHYAYLLHEAQVSEQVFDELCDEMTTWVNSVDVTPVSTMLMDMVKAEYPEFVVEAVEFNRILARYCILAELKEKVRMGWVYWNVNTPHREVVSEHAFGTQSLAWLMDYYARYELDISKVVFMMCIHETEESIMPDFTPYDPVTPEQMIMMGQKSVNVLFGGLVRGQELMDLLDEFNAHETELSRFAYFCDKLECLFRVKSYCDMGLCTIEGGVEMVKNDPKIKQNIARGAKTVAELFMMNELPKFVGTDFEEVTYYLKTYDMSK